MAASNIAGLAALGSNRRIPSFAAQVTRFVRRLHSPATPRDTDAFAGPTFRQQSPALAIEAMHLSRRYV